MPSTYSSDDLPFTVEDWSDREHGSIEILAACQSAQLANAAWAEAVKQKPGRKLVARWGRAWTMRRSWDGD
jgi:hypothetical protein